jgi:hypothetical protein
MMTEIRPTLRRLSVWLPSGAGLHHCSIGLPATSPLFTRCMIVQPSRSSGYRAARWQRHGPKLDQPENTARSRQGRLRPAQPHRTLLQPGLRTHVASPPDTTSSSRASRPSWCSRPFASGSGLSTRPSGRLVRVRRQRQLRRQSPCPDGVAGGLCPVFHADAHDS